MTCLDSNPRHGNIDSVSGVQETNGKLITEANEMIRALLAQGGTRNIQIASLIAKLLTR